MSFLRTTGPGFEIWVFPSPRLVSLPRLESQIAIYHRKQIKRVLKKVTETP